MQKYNVQFPRKNSNELVTLPFGKFPSKACVIDSFIKLKKYLIKNNMSDDLVSLLRLVREGNEKS